MSKKDPAVLFYINDWLTSTSEMDADARGWYLNLLLHNYDKGDLPNDIEKLAVLCNVKFSEFKRFEHVFKCVLEQKFEINENNRLCNERTDDILKGRETFKNKREQAGKMSYIMRYMGKNHPNEYKNEDLKIFIKDNIDLSIDLKNEHLLEQVFKQLFELYRNENENNSLINKRTPEKIKNIDVSDIEIILNTYREELASHENDSWRDNFYMKMKLKKGSLSKILDNFIIDYKLREHTKPKTINDFKHHFLNWANVQDRIDNLALYKLKT